ncbi:VOC family protein [Angustibacter sp. McL0619]|uniref:VOC family protein n=1 Tax=Angustibacter sp. McL0619 TaxID=3415676 RepID=UPI003CF1268A
MPGTEGNATTSWARLRQVVIATNEIEADITTLRSAMGFGVGFHDPELLEHGMVDRTFALSDGTYLELVAAVDPQDSLSRWTRKIGGRGGYALSIQHPDVAAVQARALAAGVQVVRAQDAFGFPILQLHPRDTAVLLEADGIADPDVWFWDGVGEDAQPQPEAAIDSILAVEISVENPAKMATLWRELLDLPAGADDATVSLGSAQLRFVEGDDTSRWTIVLRRQAGGAAPSPDLLPGVTFRFVDPA